jgi:glycosyltransferase involved in cell wall biosynthesis
MARDLTARRRILVPAALADRPLRVGVLVDLLWTPTAGGHVKTWERLARAALSAPEALELTVHFQGTTASRHILGSNVRYEMHAPVFSTARLPFLSHIPAHTDLARYHRRLASRLVIDGAGDGLARNRYDVLHTTDGAFSFARTAARTSASRDLPLVTSVHSDTARYTRIFTAATIERLVGHGKLSRLLVDWLGLARFAERRMRRRLDAHLRRCAFVLLSRGDDWSRLVGLLGVDRIGRLRRGIEHRFFDPARRDRVWLEARLGIPRDRCLVICVGRIDRGKNVLTLMTALRQLLDRGLPVHLLCAGLGADRELVRAQLGEHATCPGVIDPETLARAYASADLCAQPSEIEEISNAVLEALASGVPVLVTDASGSEHLLVEGETGLVVQGGVEAWVEALSALVTDPQRRQRMGRAARALALREIPTWRQVLLEDLLPIWRRAAGP